MFQVAGGHPEQHGHTLSYRGLKLEQLERQRVTADLDGSMRYVGERNVLFVFHLLAYHLAELLVVGLRLHLAAGPVDEDLGPLFGLHHELLADFVGQEVHVLEQQ